MLCYKIPCFDFGAHCENFILICCHLQNGIYILHPIQDQTGGNGKVPDLGCQQDSGEQSIPFLRLPHICVQAGVRLGIVMKKGVFHVSVRTGSMDALS
jgi:hypothetical protein